MKRIIAIILFIYGFITLSAQDSKVGISFLQNYSTFRFKDSEGKKYDFDYTIKYGYGLFYQRDQRIYGENFCLEGLLSYNNKGATSTLDLDDLVWSFHYINAGINIKYKFIIGSLYPQIGFGLYYGRLLKADQYIGSVYYDLMTSNGINKNDFGVNMFTGIEYEYSDYGLVFIRFNKTVGLLQLEEGGSNQKMFNRVFSIQLGLGFTINKIVIQNEKYCNSLIYAF